MNLRERFQASPGQIVGAAAGFLCAIFFIVIGFWNFILILFFTLLGLAIGCLAESGWDFAACLARLRGKKRDDEE